MAHKSLDENLILDAAAEVFAESGFSGARVDRIALLAGVNKAMIYYRIGDKRELYRRVVLRGQNGFRNALLTAVDSSSDASETLGSVIAGIAENALANRVVPSIILRELAGRASTLPEEGLQGIGNFMEIVRNLVSAGVGEGTFRNIDPVALQFLVIGSVFTLSLTGEIRRKLNPDLPGPLTADEIGSALTDILANGVLRRI